MTHSTPAPFEVVGIVPPKAASETCYVSHLVEVAGFARSSPYVYQDAKRAAAIPAR